MKLKLSALDWQHKLLLASPLIVFLGQTGLAELHKYNVGAYSVALAGLSLVLTVLALFKASPTASTEAQAIEQEVEDDLEAIMKGDPGVIPGAPVNVTLKDPEAPTKPDLSTLKK